MNELGKPLKIRAYNVGLGDCILVSIPFKRRPARRARDDLQTGRVVAQHRTIEFLVLVRVAQAERQVELVGCAKRVVREARPAVRLLPPVVAERAVTVLERARWQQSGQRRNRWHTGDVGQDLQVVREGIEVPAALDSVRLFSRASPSWRMNPS